jgi:hypothetical protein
MQEVCVELGYCGTIKEGKVSHVDFYVPSQGQVSADEFVEWVILAENLNPKTTPLSQKNAIKIAFVRHMGSYVVDATRLKWSV